MIKTLNRYTSTTAKTAEIMSRYRPIAPKPEAPANADSMNDQSSGMSQNIRQSPYLRNLRPQLQARPTRTRKRGRAAALSTPTFKRARTTTTHHVFGALCSPSPAKTLCFQGFSHGVNIPHLSVPNFSSSTTPPAAAASNNLVTLPLLPCPPAASAPASALNSREEKMIDLNHIAEIPEEKDLLKQLQLGPPTSSSSCVIAPQPIRPVGSRISVISCINDKYPSLRTMQVVVIPKKAEVVEEEVESDVLPAVISDSNNKVKTRKFGLQRDGGSTRMFMARFYDNNNRKQNLWGSDASSDRNASKIERIFMLVEDRVGEPRQEKIN